MILPKKQLQMHLKFSNLKNKICFLLISFCLQSFAMNNQLPEKLSVNAKISLLTCDEGDEIYFECTWDNSTGNPNAFYETPQDIGFGERTDEEMCYAFTLLSIGH